MNRLWTEFEPKTTPLSSSFTKRNVNGVHILKSELRSFHTWFCELSSYERSSCHAWKSRTLLIFARPISKWYKNTWNLSPSVPYDSCVSCVVCCTVVTWLAVCKSFHFYERRKYVYLHSNVTLGSAEYSWELRLMRVCTKPKKQCLSVSIFLICEN